MTNRGPLPALPGSGGRQRQPERPSEEADKQLGVNTLQQDAEYYQMRAEQEAEAARKAIDPKVAVAHLQLWELFLLRAARLRIAAGEADPPAP